MNRSREKMEQRGAVDIITLLLCFPFVWWLGGWGVLAAFGVGTAMNCVADYCMKMEGEEK